MIYYHNFLIDVPRYAEKGRENDFPDVDCCPICRAKNRLLRHGFYERNAIEGKTVYRIPICRLLCPDCGNTVSILPIFLLPYFQHTMDCIVRILLELWRNALLLCSRQLRRLYEKRAFGKQKEIEQFFRTDGSREVWPDEGKEKTIKMIQMIQALGKATFVRRWWRHQVTSFMAAPLYHGTRVANTE